MRVPDSCLAVLVLVAMAGCLVKPAPSGLPGSDAEVTTEDRRAEDSMGDLRVNPVDGKCEVPSPFEHLVV